MQEYLIEFTMNNGDIFVKEIKIPEYLPIDKSINIRNELNKLLRQDLIEVCISKNSNFIFTVDKKPIEVERTYINTKNISSFKCSKINK